MRNFFFPYGPTILLAGIFTGQMFCSSTHAEVLQITLQFMEGNKPLTNQEVRISTTLRYTDPVNGRIVFELPADITFFKLEVPGKVITLPQGGIVQIPRNPSPVITILIGSPTEQRTVSEITKKLEVLAENVNNLEDYLKQSRAVVDEYLKENNLVLEQYKIQQLLKIQEEKEFIREGQLKTIPLMTRVLNQYISCTKDLCDLLDQSSEKLFHDTGAGISQLNKRTDAYNKAYEDLNREKETIITYLENYWGEGILNQQTRQLLDMALRDIHQLEMLISNSLLKDINDYNEGVKGKRKKKEIIHDLRDTSARTRIMIENLDKDKERIIQKMKEYYPSDQA